MANYRTIYWQLTVIIAILTSLLSAVSLSFAQSHHHDQSVLGPGQDVMGSGHLLGLPPCPHSATLLHLPVCNEDDEDCNPNGGSGHAHLMEEINVTLSQLCQFTNKSLGKLDMHGGLAPTHASKTPMHESHAPMNGSRTPMPMDHHGHHGTRGNPHNPSLHNGGRPNHHGNHGRHGNHHMNRNETFGNTDNKTDDRTGILVAIIVGTVHALLTIVIIIYIFRMQRAKVNQSGSVVDKSEPVVTAVSSPCCRNKPVVVTVMPSPVAVKHLPQDENETQPRRDVGVEAGGNTNNAAMNVDV